MNLVHSNSYAKSKNFDDELIYLFDWFQVYSYCYQRPPSNFSLVSSEQVPTIENPYIVLLLIFSPFDVGIYALIVALQ